MPTFQYEALDSSGQETHGQIEAEDEVAAVANLHGQGIFPTKMTAQGTFSVLRRVEFRDTDAAGIVHFSAFFPMMESAEHELLRSLGISIMDHGNPDQLTWPRVSASCDYQAAAKFEDMLCIEVTISKIGQSSVDFDFQFKRDGQGIARGRITTVCCLLKPGGGLKKQPIPDSIRQLLSQHT